MKRILTFLILFAVLFFSACNSGNTSKKEKDLSFIWAPGNKKHFMPGVVQKVYVAGDSTQSYAVYLPKDYQDSLKWPVIYFFDPQAAGSLPVDKYAVWAEQFGYILFGSNNLKNRMSSEEMNRYIRSFFDDTYKRFSLDEKRITLAGFSGGARVASSLALTDPSVRGVIACGGGLPSTRQLPPVHFDFLSFAGSEDFNLPELIQMDLYLQSQPCRHYLIRFAGKHEWPDSLVFKNSFFWLDFNAMRDRLIPKNDSLIRLFENNTLNAIHRLPATSVLHQSALLSKIITFLQGLAPTEKYEKKLKALYANPFYQQQKKSFAVLLSEESQQQQFYIRAFASRSLPWWEDAVRKLNREIRQSTGDSKSSKQRLLHFLSLASYMQADAALHQHKDAEAKKYVSIYKLVDPDNAYVYYFSAVLAARKGDREKTLKWLRKAVDLGFDKKDVLAKNQDFTFLKGDPEFDRITGIEVSDER
ncbi:MAG: hypothetical protein J7K46_08020 [Bacteroidales bacterium]|nr:hypothetical protein [Bacteroidales bacterium]